MLLLSETYIPPVMQSVSRHAWSQIPSLTLHYMSLQYTGTDTGQENTKHSFMQSDSPAASAFIWTEVDDLFSKAGQQAERVAVLREAFLGSSRPPTPLSSVVASLGEGRVAVASTTSEYENRLLVDEYQQGADGKFALKTVATDLYR